MKMGMFKVQVLLRSKTMLDVKLNYTYINLNI